MSTQVLGFGTIVKDTILFVQTPLQTFKGTHVTDTLYTLFQFLP